MSVQETPPTSDGEGQEPETVEEGQEPDAEVKDESQEDEPKTFSEDYVKDLRKQAASQRTKLTKLERELEGFREASKAGKSDTERLTKQAEDADARAIAAELKASAYEVAASRSLDLKWASYLTGDSREEQEEKAEELVKLLATQGSSKAPSFDGGARTTPTETKTPGEEHNLLLLKAAGRIPDR